jgi:type I restriction enzyme S subunit
MEKQLIPKLRFPEFKKNWETKIIKEIVEVNPRNEKLPNEFVYIDLESVNGGKLEKENKININDAPSRAQRLLKKGDILYQTVRPYQKNNYFFNKENNYTYVASTGYAQLRSVNNVPIFIYQLIHTDFFVNKVLLRCTGTSYPAINSTDLSEIIISIPQYEEQKKIALFLTSIDVSITLLTQQKEKLELYKKGIMQQLFLQKIRFKDDNGILTANHLECNGLYELSETLNYALSEGEQIISVEKINSWGEHLNYDYSKLIKKRWETT